MLTDCEEPTPPVDALEKQSHANELHKKSHGNEVCGSSNLYQHVQLIIIIIIL